MKKLKLGLSCAFALTMAGGMVSCQSDENMSQSGEKGVEVNAVALVTMDDQTRTSYTPSETSFDLAWSENDQIVVISEDGTRNIGVMKLTEGAGAKDAKFEGKLVVEDNDSKAHVYYMGKKVTSGLKLLSYNTSFDVAAQNSALANVPDFDVMHALAELNRDSSGDVSMQFNIKSLVSCARFSFHLPDGVSATNETAVTIKGKNIFKSFTLNFADASFSDLTEGEITIMPDWSNADGGDAFVTFVPATDAVTEFEVTVDNQVYKAALDSKAYVASMFYCGGKPLHGKDIYFTRDGSWTLNYDATEGTNGPEADAVNEVFTPSYTFTVTDGVPVREGYKFLGWADSADAAVAKYNAGSRITLTRPETSKTIYAVWQEEEWHHRTYTLHYDKGDGSTITESQSYGPYCSKPWVFYTDNYTDAYPTKTGYTFLGWADTENASTVVYAKTGATIDLTKEVFEKTVYPVWKKNGAEGNVTAPGSDRKPY